jgi:cytosine/uracil/thiamine/allantoin permease
LPLPITQGLITLSSFLEMLVVFEVVDVLVANVFSCLEADVVANVFEVVNFRRVGEISSCVSVLLYVGYPFYLNLQGRLSRTR